MFGTAIKIRYQERFLTGFVRDEDNVIYQHVDCT